MSERRLLLRVLPAALAALFVFAVLPQPAAANPAVPYCDVGSVNPLGNVPGVIMPELCEQATGRVFPEPSTLSTAGSPYALNGASTQPTTDFVSFYEAEAGFKYLAAKYPDYITVNTVGTSVGNCATGPNCADSAKVSHPIYMLEITNKKSPFPMEKRQAMLFMLSIHGNEKGGREGGFRVAEDLVKGIGFAAETVQDGAGMPTPLVKPTGGNVQTYADYLDFMRIFLLFPNADGWAHDEVPFISDPYCGAGPGFCRTNGHNVDLNRQAPTAGWQNPQRDPVGEPESIGYYNWMLQNKIDWRYAIDIHGMLNHQNFGAIMLPAGAMTPQEMQRSIRLAETLKDRLNTDPHFQGWENAFAAGETAESTASQAAEDNNACVDQSTGPGGHVNTCQGALNAVGSSQFAEYYTVIDAIGYTDSGFNGDYFAQNSGLNAPGYDIELAYNHITTDSQYGPGQVFNDYHVHMVREIVKSFMDAAALDVKISFETRGVRTAYVEPSFVATSLDDTNKTPGGWADKNTGDDLWDYGKNGGFTTRPAQYWDDLKPFVRNGDEPGVLSRLTAGTLTRAQLDQYQQLVIPGSAIKDLESNPAAITAIKEWTQAGGNLVLTDSALRFFDLAGLTNKGVDELDQYMGGIRMDLTKPVFFEYQDSSKPENRNVRGGVKQTYEPTPLGFETGANAAPNWFVKPDAFAKLNGDQWGLTCGTTNINDPCTGNGVGLGKVPLGKGQVQFIGSLLPDPTEEFYHPYGLDPYATTYSGNQILRNMLYFGNVLKNPPVVITDQGIEQSANEPTVAPVAEKPVAAPGKKSPGLDLLPIVALLGAAAIVLRRRR